METQVYNIKGESIKKIILNDNLFNVPYNADLIAQAIHVYRSNERSGTAHTKTRGEIRGGGKKPWPQKHTGRARASSIRSPLWRGGGTVFGPRKDKNYTRKLNKKVRKKAMAIILSQKLRDKQLFVVDSISHNYINKSKEVRSVLENLQIFFKQDKKPTHLFILDDDRAKKIKKAFSNFKNAAITSFRNINAYELLKKKYVIIEETALQLLTKHYAQD